MTIFKTFLYRLTKKLGVYRPLYRMRVTLRYPFLLGGRKQQAASALRPAYDRYITEISVPDMAISFELAVFLYVFCEGLKPQRILDLGSGFSSFVLRRYAAASGAVVWSVDDSPEWLARTAEFLAGQGLSTERLETWDTFRRSGAAGFDLVLHDLGSMALRAEVLTDVLRLARPERGVVILDDMHFWRYRTHVEQTLARCDCRYTSLIDFTRDSFTRYSGMVSHIREIPG